MKYRKKIIDIYDAEIKTLIKEVSETSNFEVEKMESDRDHIHILVSARSDISPSQIITRIKQKTTFDLWQKHEVTLKKHFWKEHTFWNRGYFVASIGSVSEEAIEKYIENQRNSSATLKRSQASCTIY